MKRSARHEKVISAVCRALWRKELTAIPGKEEFLARFAPELARPYEVNIPLGGIRTNGRGRPVNWGSKSAVQSQNTKRQNEATRIYDEAVLIIQSELEQQQTKP